jgi:hypothetical protein
MEATHTEKAPECLSYYAVEAKVCTASTVITAIYHIEALSME